MSAIALVSIFLSAIHPSIYFLLVLFLVLFPQIALKLLSISYCCSMSVVSLDSCPCTISLSSVTISCLVSSCTCLLKLYYPSIYLSRSPLYGFCLCRQLSLTAACLYSHAISLYHLLPSLVLFLVVHVYHCSTI